MVVMYRFVFWFSTRFGSLVVAIFTLVQSMPCLISCVIGLENQEAIQKQVEVWLRTNNMLFMKDILEGVQKDPDSYLAGFITYLSLHCFSCFLMLYGALKVSEWFVYPFLILEIARLFFLAVNFVIAMLLVKENILNLGLLIVCCCGGGFILLLMFYLWFCVLSFVQIVKELEFTYNMGHYEGSNLNLQDYESMNIPQLGAEYFPKYEGFAPIPDYSRHYNKNFMNENPNTMVNLENGYSNVLARPVY